MGHEETMRCRRKREYQIQGNQSKRERALRRGTKGSETSWEWVLVSLRVRQLHLIRKKREREKRALSSHSFFFFSFSSISIFSPLFLIKYNLCLQLYEPYLFLAIRNRFVFLLLYFFFRLLFFPFFFLFLLPTCLFRTFSPTPDLFALSSAGLSPSLLDHSVIDAWKSISVKQIFTSSLFL